MGSGIQDRIEHDNGLPGDRYIDPDLDCHAVYTDKHYGSLVPEIKIESGVKKEHDNVNSPKHYQLLPGVEVIDVRKAIFKQIPEGTTPFAIDCYSRALEYLMRMWSKNGLEDAQKARTYLNWLITELTEGNKK